MLLCGCNGVPAEQVVFQELKASPDRPFAGETVRLHASISDPSGYTTSAPAYEYSVTAGELVSACDYGPRVRGTSIVTQGCDALWVTPATPGTYTVRVQYADVSKELRIRVRAKPGAVETVGPKAE